MIRTLLAAGAALCTLALAACGDTAPGGQATETVVQAPVEFWVRAEGELKAAKAGPLDALEADRVLFDSLTNNNSLGWSLTGPLGSVITNRSLRAMFAT